VVVFGAVVRLAAVGEGRADDAPAVGDALTVGGDALGRVEAVEFCALALGSAVAGPAEQPAVPPAARTTSAATVVNRCPRIVTGGIVTSDAAPGRVAWYRGMIPVGVRSKCRHGVH